VAPIFVDPAGNNAIVIVTGANDLLTDDEINDARPAMAEAGLVVCQLEIPVETTLKALRAARAEGARTVLNPAPARADLSDELLQLSDVFCPNQGEAGLLTGRQVRTADDAAKAAGALMNRGAASVVVTLGEQGCVVATAQATTHVPGVTVDAVDSTGAGDAFVGALAYLLADGKPLAASARFANEVAALSVLGKGTQSSFPDRGDLPDRVLQALL
jgi:ribokinase